jgi:pilus assembly protein CpaF
MPREAIFEASVRYFLEPIIPFLDDDSVTEIMVNGPDQVYIERYGRLELTGARFASEDALRSAVYNISQWVGREITEERPVLDARLPDGSRVHAIIPPSARKGTYLTIRKFSGDVLTLDDFVRLGSLSDAAREFLELCVLLRKNILIAGGSGSGKTSLLGALARVIPVSERIIVIEDTSEVRLPQPHCLFLEAHRPSTTGRGGLSIRELFLNSLRMRPDRIIVGEVRGGEALDMIQSMLSGHSGSLSTIHASSPRDALTRLEILSLMSGVDIPVYVARAQVASAIHLVVQLARFPEDGSRKVTRIAEVCGLDAEDRYELRELFQLRTLGKDARGRIRAQLEHTGKRPSFAREVVEQGMTEHVEFSAPLWELDGHL